MRFRRLLFLLLAAVLALPGAAAAETPDPIFTDEETVVIDEENGRWSYQSDVFSVFIERHRETIVPDEKTGEKPLVYHVAHIYMREYNSFRSGFSDAVESGTALLAPSKIARRERAVIAITGDNVTQQEANLKGAIIRHGKVFSNHDGESVMAIKDDLTMEIFPRASVDAEQLLEMGIRETFSFGPWLILDGEPNPDVARFRVNRINPRVGLGMIEPGHFVAIVADGRQAGYSYGLTLPQFRDMFVKEGCVQAYNLDGGCSTGLVFMGEHLNRHDGTPGAADYQRAWVDALMWGYSALVPNVDDPLLHDGNQEGQP